MESVSDRDDLADILEEARDFFDNWDMEHHASDLENAIRAYQHLADETADSTTDRYRIFALVGLGEAYRERFTMTKQVLDITKSIESMTDAIELSPSDDFGLCERLNVLAYAYLERYQATDDSADLHNGIRFAKDLIHFRQDCGIPEETLKLGGWPEWLGDYYESSSLRSESVSDMTDAIYFYELAVLALGPDHTNRGSLLFHLGCVYGDRHQATGSMEDLDRCISCYIEAKATLPEDHDEKARLLHNLGLAYRDRFRKREALEDIQVAIHHVEKSVLVTPNTNPDRATFVSSLGSFYADMYGRTMKPEHLTKSLQLKEEALALASKSGFEQTAQQARIMANTANGHHSGCTTTDYKEGLDRAMKQIKEAISRLAESYPDGHPDRFRYFFSLGLMYRSQFDQQDEPKDDQVIKHSIELQEFGIAGMPEDDMLYAYRVSQLGTAYEELYYISDDETHWDKALQKFEEALRHVPSAIRFRLMAGMMLYKAHARGPNRPWQKAYESSLETLSLVPQLLSPSLSTMDRLLLIRETAGLGPDAAALALKCGKSPLIALQHLEQSRGTILETMNRLRIGERVVGESDSELTEELKNLRTQVEAPSTSANQGENSRYESGQRLEAIQSEIEKLPSFQSAIPVMSEQNILAAAGRGPIVVINTSPFRCDAFIIDQERIRVLNLPHLKLEDLEDIHKHDRANPEVLEMLWEYLAKPVLDVLGFNESPSNGCWPRVWWIPTGILTNFPIHAFGSYLQGRPVAVNERVISSYCSSIKGLLHSRSSRPRSRTATHGKRVVLVAMRNTEGQSELLHAPDEAQMLESVCPALNMTVVKPPPVRSDVLAALDHCEVFHFAGHGMTEHNNPVQSALLLKDWKEAALTVECLFEANLHDQGPSLAYLSACGTSRVGHGEFIDEGFHLISGCQLAGFRNVIGTLWDVDDEMCVDIARETYQWMGSHGMNDDSIGEGLHHAMRRARDKWLEGFAEEDSDLRGRNQGWPGAAGGGCAPARTIEPEDEVKFAKATWIPYVHYGV